MANNKAELDFGLHGVRYKSRNPIYYQAPALLSMLLPRSGRSTGAIHVRELGCQQFTPHTHRRSAQPQAPVSFVCSNLCAHATREMGVRV